MKVRYRLFWAILLILMCIHSVMAADSLTIVYSGNLDGELEPCGCSDTGNFGGIKRRVTTLDSLRKQNPNLVALSSGGLLAAEGANDRIKSEYILKGFGNMSYDAVALQWRDLVFGASFATQVDLPWVAGNWQDQADSKITRSRVIGRKIGERRINLSFFSWLNPEDSPLKAMKGTHSVVNSNLDALKQLIQAAKEAGHLVVLSTSLLLDEVKEKFDLEPIDIVIIKSAYELFGEPIQQGKTLVLQPGSRGMRIAKLELVLGSDHHIESWQHQVIPMPDSVPDAKRMASWYKEYNDKVKQDYLKRVALRKQQQSGESNYIGENACASCHAAQHKIWQESDHAEAYDDLENVEKSFDPECLQCHTVGFNQPGGFFDMNMSSHLLGVQCESCHGESRKHAASAGKVATGNRSWTKAQMCQQCHTQPHSPDFKLELYWPKIAH